MPEQGTNYVHLGAKAGGTSVDRSLHEFMHHCFGIAFESLPVEKVGAGSKFMEAFEILKRQFTGDFDEDTRYELPLKMCKLDKTDGRVTNHYDFDEDTVMLTGYVHPSRRPVIFTDSFKRGDGGVL